MDIELETSTLMMIVFIFAFIISIWKIYPFLQTRTLADDDTTLEAQAELVKFVLKHLGDEDKETVNTKELLEKIKNDTDFNKEHFWRFNQNKLNQLLKKLD
ncbi:hypothetical protein [Sulfurimonas sp.]|uniref:hypothetical protein n=1 Tax=Sulfurimonas sp. TaxID=2022749 RepID=UPI0039E3F945